MNCQTPCACHLVLIVIPTYRHTYSCTHTVHLIRFKQKSYCYFFFYHGLLNFLHRLTTVQRPIYTDRWVKATRKVGRSLQEFAEFQNLIKKKLCCYSKLQKLRLVWICDITTVVKGVAVTCVRNSTYKRFVAAAQICGNDLSRNVSRPLKLATLLFSSFPRCQPDWCAHVMTQQYVCCPQAPASVSLPCCYQTWVLSLMWLTLPLKVRRDENWLSYIIFQFLLDLHMSGRYIY